MSPKMPFPAEKIARCPWRGIEDPIYARYHDTEWGVPLVSDRAIFEKLVLEGFQSGLSWLTILRKRENFRRAFHNFDAAKIARFATKDVARLMDDEGIVRNKMKIEATIENARAYLTLSKHTPLAHFVWSFAARPARRTRITSSKDIPAATEQSARLSKALKSEGFRFVGPTTVYAFMQSVGDALTKRLARTQ